MDKSGHEKSDSKFIPRLTPKWARKLNPPRTSDETKIRPMKIKAPLTISTCLKRMGRLRTVCTTRLLLLLLALPAAVQAQYTYATNNGTITITGYTGSGGAVTIPSSINSFPVTSIGDWAFYYRTSLTIVTIPTSVTSIGDHAFDYCIHLTS